MKLRFCNGIFQKRQIAVLIWILGLFFKYKLLTGKVMQTLSKQTQLFLSRLVGSLENRESEWTCLINRINSNEGKLLPLQFAHIKCFFLKNNPQEPPLDTFAIFKDLAQKNNFIQINRIQKLLTQLKSLQPKVRKQFPLEKTKQFIQKSFSTLKNFLKKVENPKERLSKYAIEDPLYLTYVEFCQFLNETDLVIFANSQKREIVGKNFFRDKNKIKMTEIQARLNLNTLRSISSDRDSMRSSSVSQKEANLKSSMFYSQIVDQEKSETQSLSYPKNPTPANRKLGNENEDDEKKLQLSQTKEVTQIKIERIKWNDALEQQRHPLKYQNNSQNSWIKNDVTLQKNQGQPNFVNTCFPLPHLQSSNYIRLKVSVPGKYNICVYQSSQRIIGSNCKSSTYSVMRLFIQTQSGHKLKYLGSKMVEASNACGWEGQFAEGTYLVAVSIDWINNDDNTSTLVSCGPEKVDFTEVPSSISRKFQEELIDSCCLDIPIEKREWKGQLAGIYAEKYLSINKGMGLLKIVNKSLDKKNIKLGIKFQTEQLRPIKPGEQLCKFILQMDEVKKIGFYVQGSKAVLKCQVNVFFQTPY